MRGQLLYHPQGQGPQHGGGTSSFNQPPHLLTCGLEAWLGFPLEQRALAKNMGSLHLPGLLLAPLWLFASGTLALQPSPHSFSRHAGKQLRLPWPFHGLEAEEEKHGAGLGRGLR